TIDSTITAFRRDSEGRNKKAIPSLGEFLPLCSVPSKYTWEDIREAYFKEHLCRYSIIIIFSLKFVLFNLISVFVGTPSGPFKNILNWPICQEMTLIWNVMFNSGKRLLKVCIRNTYCQSLSLAHTRTRTRTHTHAHAHAVALAQNAHL